MTERIDRSDCGALHCVDDEIGSCRFHDVWVICRDCETTSPLVDGVISEGAEPSLQHTILVAFRCPACESSREPWSSLEWRIALSGDLIP